MLDGIALLVNEGLREGVLRSKMWLPKRLALSIFMALALLLLAHLMVESLQQAYFERLFGPRFLLPLKAESVNRCVEVGAHSRPQPILVLQLLLGSLQGGLHSSAHCHGCRLLSSSRNFHSKECPVDGLVLPVLRLLHLLALLEKLMLVLHALQVLLL